MKEKVLDRAQEQFRPEFLNRIDATVVFRSLTVEEIREIVDLMLARVRDQLRAQQIDARGHRRRPRTTSSSSATTWTTARDRCAA